MRRRPRIGAAPTIRPSRRSGLDQHPNTHAVTSAAVDLGASTGRVLLGSLEGDRLTVCEAARFVTPTFLHPASGYRCWDLDRILSETTAGLHACAAAGPLLSVGVDSWAVDFVLLDGDMRRVAPAVCYREKHTAGIMAEVQARIPATDIYRRTGIQFQPFNTLYQIAGLARRQPQWISAARRLLMIPDYLHFTLCGVAANEYTNASTTQMLSLEGSWDQQLSQIAGISADCITAPLPAGSLLGEMKLKEQSVHVIAPATHDTASAVAGTPLDGPDEAYISSGTWSLMGIESPAPIATPEAMRMNFTNEGGYGRRFRVLKNIMGLWPLQRVCDEAAAGSLDTLLQEAAAEPAWRSLINLDDAAFLNPKNMTGTLHHYCRQTGQPVPESLAALTRCILDSLALCYRRAKCELEALRGNPLKRLRIVGGGSRNRLLNQLCADACSLPVSAGPVEASALGNLAAQWIALGYLRNLDEARALIRASFTCDEYKPRSTAPAAVLDRFEQLTQTRYTEAVECT